MKKICFLGGYGGGPECGERLAGPQRLYLELGTRLPKEFQVSFVHLGDQDHATSRDSKPEFVVKKGLFSFFKTIRVLKKINPEVIHGHGSLNMALALVLIQKMMPHRTKIIITFTDFKKNILKDYHILNRMDRVIVQTNYAREKLIRQGVQSGRIQKITYGIEENFYQAKKCPEIRKLSPKILLYYGDARYERGFHLLLQALPYLSQDILMVLCLRKCEKGFNLQRIKSLPYNNYKILTLSEYPCTIPDLIKSSDVVILPFVKNTLEPPLTTMEVSAIGTPLLATDIGGTKEVVGENTIFINNLSAKGIAAEVNALFKTKNRMIYRPKLYSWKKTIQEMKGIY